jgi:hypothetical protein
VSLSQPYKVICINNLPFSQGRPLLGCKESKCPTVNTVARIGGPVAHNFEGSLPRSHSHPANARQFLERVTISFLSSTPASMLLFVLLTYNKIAYFIHQHHRASCKLRPGSAVTLLRSLKFPLPGKRDRRRSNSQRTKGFPGPVRELVAARYPPAAPAHQGAANLPCPLRNTPGLHGSNFWPCSGSVE